MDAMFITNIVLLFVIPRSIFYWCSVSTLLYFLTHLLQIVLWTSIAIIQHILLSLLSLALREAKLQVIFYCIKNKIKKKKYQQKDWVVILCVCVCIRYLGHHSIKLLQLGGKLAHFVCVALLLLLLLRCEAPPQVFKLHLLLLFKLRLQRKQWWRGFMNEKAAVHWRFICSPATKDL